MIILDQGPQGQPVCFDAPRDLVVAQSLDAVAPALARIESARRQGLWAAGWIAYEAGYAFEERLARLQPRSDGPLLVFGLYDAPGPVPPHPAGPVRLAPLVPQIDRAAYDAAFARAKAFIAAGDCYQVNLTFPLATRLIEGTPRDLAAALARLQPVGYGAYADMGIGPVIVSRSPELFFRLTADGGIEARPMKGTAPRHSDPLRDAQQAAALGASLKDRAENLMIVDLLRNDIARLAQVGSVRVPELFAIETFATLHQMTSRITARLAQAPDLAQLMAALFPCGSITGAPKIRAIQILYGLETGPRGVYCGSLGWMAPDGSAEFSVAIRTLAIRGDAITLNVGGGVVHDSTAASEWEEALWKARYIEPLTSPAFA